MVPIAHIKKAFFICIVLPTLLYPTLADKVLICGVCKNVAQRLPYTIKIMEKIGGLFEDFRIIVYENNSTDSTPQLLKQWTQENNKVVALSETLSHAELAQVIINRYAGASFFNTECIARARNIVLDVAMSDNYNEFKFLIWVDMDFKLEPNYEAFKEIFTTDTHWDAVFAYGINEKHEYFDWYALRDEQYPLGPEMLGNSWWRIPKKMNLTNKSPWYPVYSAFGGCGIYKKDALKDCHYSGLVTKDLGLVYEQVIRAMPQHTFIHKYLHSCAAIKEIKTISSISPELSDTRSNIGIDIPGLPNTIVWRMNTTASKYPTVCEHVPLHASMIINGHNKLFINPRLVFYYVE